MPTWLDIADIWFNGYRHSLPSDMLGPSEGDALSDLIIHGEFPWNEAFGQRAITLQPGRNVDLAGGMKVWILSPTQPQLAALGRQWAHGLKADADLACSPADSLGRKDVWPPPPLADILSAHSRTDTSVANGSSIALMLGFHGKHVLLAADSFAAVLVNGIRSHWSQNLDVEVLKLSHHGSQANTSDALLSAIKCRRFLISTNGSVHAHPDQALIARLLSNIGYPEIIFNYETAHTAKWKQPPVGWPIFTATYPRWDEAFVRVAV